jgi:hypothetical protein
MNPRIIARFLTALLLAAAATATPVCAKMVDLSAHFEQENYWNIHAIYLASLSDIKSLPTGGGYVISFIPVKMISGQVEMTSRSLQLHSDDNLDGSSGQYPAGFPTGVGYPTEILVSEDNRYHQVTVVGLAHSLDDQALVAVVERIAKLRSNPTVDALLNGAASEFDLESEYSVNRLLSLPDQMFSGEKVERLQSLANDGERPAELRIAAEEAVLKFSGVAESARSEAEHNWLLGVVEGAKRSARDTDDLEDLLERMRPIIYKLFDLKSKQGDSADYILRLVADSSVPAGLRAVACSALSGVDEQVFNFDHPDERFERMFDTYLGLLKDKNPDLRISGMSMLFDRTVSILKNYSSPDLARQYGDRAAQALQQAIEVEKDSRVLNFFQSRLQFYEDWKNKQSGPNKK